MNNDVPACDSTLCIDLTQSEEVSSTTTSDVTTPPGHSDDVIFIEDPTPAVINHSVESYPTPPASCDNSNDVIIISPQRGKHSTLSGLAALIDTEAKFRPLKKKHRKIISQAVQRRERADIVEIPEPVENRPVVRLEARQDVDLSVNDVQRLIKRAEKRVTNERKEAEEALFPDKESSTELAAKIVNKIDEGLSVVDTEHIQQVGDSEVVVVNDADWEVVDESDVAVVNDKDWEVVDEAGEEIKVTQEINSSDKDRCAICLAASFSNRSFLNSCFHAFCYFCIMQWSEISQTCPLCKSAFRYIVHDVKSITDYKETHISKEPALLPPERRAMFRPTVRYRTTIGSTGRTAGPSARPPPPVRVAKRRHRAPDDIIKESRERVYTNLVYAKPPLDCRKGKQRICTPDFFKQYPGTKHRLAQWLNNELEVLLYENKDHVTFVMQIVWCALDKYPIQSEDFKREVRAFLFDNTDLFCHELQMFAQSPYDFKTYLQKVQYDFPTIDLEEASSSSSLPSHWDSSPVRYIGGEGSNNTIARSRWDDDSPVMVAGPAMTTTTTEKVVTMVTEVTADEVEVAVMSDDDSIEFLYEKDRTEAPPAPVCLTSPSTPVYITSPPSTPVYLGSPGDTPCPTTPVYVTVDTTEQPQPSTPVQSPAKQSPLPSKGKGKQKRKKVLVDDEPNHNKRPQLRSMVVRRASNDELPCSSRDIT